MELAQGESLGPYTIVSLVGAGGMGEVYRAHDARLDRVVAVKVMRDGLVDPDARERFFREARTVAKFRHPNVIAVFDVGEHDDRPFIVMEFVEGPSLAALIDQRRPIPLDRKLRYVIDICDGLAHAHDRGIVHRDIKPSNVLIDDDRARIADFGIAREATRSTLTSIAGSPNYFAPEQLAGKGDHRSDLFSLGALVYELITGAQAFPGSVAEGVLYRILHGPSPSLPTAMDVPGLHDVVARALEKDPVRRFQSAAEFRMAVERVLTGLTSGSEVATVPIEVPREAEAVRFRRRLIQAATPNELRRLKYEVEAFLTSNPADVDARMLADEVDRAMEMSQPRAPAVLSTPSAGAPPRASSRRRIAAYAAAFGVAVIAVSSYTMTRLTVSMGKPPDTIASVATTTSAAPASPETVAASRPAPPAATGPKTSSVTTAVRAAPPPSDVPARTTPLTPPAASPPTTAPSREEPAIRGTIERYRTAYERLDAKAVAAVYPSASVEELKDVFADLRSLEYTFHIDAIEMSPDGREATVTASTEQRATTRQGTRTSNRQSVTMNMRKNGPSWIIENVTGR